MRNSLLSGQVGIPDGAYTLLQQSDLEQAVSFIRHNQETLERVIGEETGLLPSGGGGIKNWIRFSANGTKVAGTGITVSRTAVGTYLLTASAAFPTSGGSFQYGVVALPSTVSGNGGDGVSPYKAYSAFATADTDQYGSQDINFFYATSTNSIYLLGPANDKIWIHDLDDFTGTPTQVSAGTPIIGASGSSGVMSREEDYIFLSADTGEATSTVRAFKISDNSVTDFGGTGGAYQVVGAFTDSGTVYVLTYNGSGTLSLYAPDFGTPALGSAVRTWSIVPVSGASYRGAWDADGNIWFSPATNLIRVDPLLTGSNTFAYPSEVGASPSSAGPMVFDSLRNRFYVQAGGASGNWLYTFTGWSKTVDNSGSWARFVDKTSFAPISMWHDPVADLLFIPNDNDSFLYRYLGETGQSIDTFDFQTVTSAQMRDSHSAFYINECGYIFSAHTGDTVECLTRICYKGDELDVGGNGASFVNSVLLCQYQIVNATQAYVYAFRSISPPVRADAEITAAMVSDADTSAAVTITHPSTGAASVNAIGNGAFNIWQRGTSFSSVNSNTVTADRWRYLKSGAMVHDISRSTDVPTSAQAGRVFDYSILVDCTTVDTSLAASDYAALVHRVEGYFWAGFAQRALMLSFWVKATLTGTYCVGLTNSGGNRSYVGEYTVNTADTWEYKTISITSSPSAGTWDYVDGVGLGVYFPLAAGTDFQITADTWSTTSAASFATSSQVNACNSIANNFRITGVQLQAGTVATEFEHLSFADELDRALRYYEKSFQYATQPATAAGTNGSSIGVQVVGSSASQGMAIDVRWRVRKRSTSPTVVTYNTAGAGNEIRNVTRSEDCSSTSFSGTENDLQMRFACTTSGSSAAGDVLAIHWTCDAEL